MKSVWMKLGKLGEEVILDYLNEKEEVEAAKQYDHSKAGRKGKQIADFERTHGDIIMKLQCGDIRKAEVKVDDLHQFTGNIGFEIWAKKPKDKLDISYKKGWAHPQVTTEYDQLYFVLPNVGVLQISDYKNFKQWMYDNKDEFESLETSASTQQREGKVSVSWYIKLEKLLELPMVALVDVDLTRIEKFVNKNEMLNDRRKRYLTF